MHRQRSAFALVFLVLLSILVYPAALPVHADTLFTVNDPGDGGDSNTADGMCNNGSGVCTLRAAIQQANALIGDDTIEFSGVTLVNIATALSVTSSITINGTGVTVDNTGTGIVFNTSGSGTFIVDGLIVTGGNIGIVSSGGSLTLQNGARITGNGGANGVPTGIYAVNSILTITGSGTAVTANIPNGWGPAIYTESSTVYLQDGAEVSNNNSPTAFEAPGVFISTESTLIVDNATITRNNDGLYGGGIFAYDSSTVTLRNGAVVSQNASNLDGGGIALWEGSSLTMESGSVITGNTAAGDGGGVYVSYNSAVNISDSRITFNTATGSGNALFHQRDTSTVNITNSCIVCNGDNAIASTLGGSTTPILAGNWWGSEWGPYYSTSTEGLQCSPGDSLATNLTLAQYGIGVSDPVTTCTGAPPEGDWLTSVTGGCTGDEIEEMSTFSHGARICVPPP